MNTKTIIIWQIAADISNFWNPLLVHFIVGDKRSCNPNLQVVITHAWHVCSQYSFGLPLIVYGMHRTLVDHARLDLLSLVIWSPVLWPSVTWNLRKAQRWCKNIFTRSFDLRLLSPALRNLWLILVNPFAPGDFAEKRVLKLVEWFSGHCRAIKS